MSQPAAARSAEVWTTTAGSFFGRRRECEALMAELLGGTRLLTIVGPSGMGKTRLATQVAELLREADTPFAGEIRFCSLLDCETPSDVEETVARVMGLPDEPGAQLSRQGSAAAPMLLILDNVDHLSQEAAAVAAHLCDHLENLQILITSIAPLEVEWEVCFELGPLEHEDALALYRDRTREAGYRLASEEEAVAEALVEKLDRIPLAIELAAARARELPPRHLLEGIDERLEHLRVQKPGRHGSLEAAISLSWALLREEERRLLARASVFVGGFTLESIGAVLGRTPPQSGQVDLELVELLEGVMSKALVQRDGSAAPRFSFYESLRDFAAKALRESGEEEDALARHAAFFREKGKLHSRRREAGEHASSSMAWLQAERENLLAAHRRTFGSDPLASAELGVAVLGIQKLEGAPASELELYDSVVDAARRSGDPGLLIRALITRPSALMRHGQLERCAADLHEVLQLCEEQGARREEGEARVALGVLLTRQAKLDEAWRQLSIAERIATEDQNLILESVTRIGQALLSACRDAYGEADRYNQRTAELARLIGSRSIEARALANLGVGRGYAGKFREGRQLFREALAITREQGDRGATAYMLILLAGFEVQAGDLDAAERCLEEAFRGEEIHGNRRYEAYGIESLGLIALERGDLRLAEQRLSQGLRLCEEAGDRLEYGVCTTYLAAASALRGKAAEARRLEKEARSFFEGLGISLTLEAVELVDGFLNLQEARRLASMRRWEEASTLEARVRAQLAAVAPRGGYMARPTRILHRILEGALGELLKGGEEGEAEQLVVGSGCSWVEFGGDKRVELSTRESLRKMLWALVQQRLSAPGTSLSSEELFEAGWAERIKPDSAGRRVYTGIWTLRTLGLSTAILHDGEGYLLDPNLAVVVRED